MPINRLALIRYKTIDNCLRNPYRRWTIDDIVEACSDALYEFEGKKQGVSLRTIQLDIQNMRSEKLGYNAPIVVVDKKYYIYDDPNYSITNMPLTSSDLNTLSQITHTLKQFEGFSQFSDMDEVLKKIENKVFAVNNQAQSIIDFEKNNLLKGIRFLNEIYDAIKNKICLKIVYQSFKSRPTTIYLSPYLLKEYRNRWFLFGKRSYNTMIAPLALDRIVKLSVSKKESFVENTIFNSEEYFKDIVGVTRFENRMIEQIVFWVVKEHAPYLKTKPIHASQKTIEDTISGSVFSINVIPNPELERELFSYGEFLKVIEPQYLLNKFKDKVSEMQRLYTE